MPLAVCAECDEDIQIPGRPRLGQKVSCPHCGAQLEVVDLEPLELDWVFDDEDEDDEFEDSDDSFDDDDDEEDDLELEEGEEVDLFLEIDHEEIVEPLDQEELAE
jgi:lysine biosynthesis protein LysW